MKDISEFTLLVKIYGKGGISDLQSREKNVQNSKIALYKQDLTHEEWVEAINLTCNIISILHF